MTTFNVGDRVVLTKDVAPYKKDELATITDTPRSETRRTSHYYKAHVDGRPAPGLFTARELELVELASDYDDNPCVELVSGEPFETVIEMDFPDGAHLVVRTTDTAVVEYKSGPPV